MNCGPGCRRCSVLKWGLVPSWSSDPKGGLSYLGPEIVRALLADSQSNALTPSRLLRLSKDLPHDWKEQRCFLGFAA